MTHLKALKHSIKLTLYLHRKLILWLIVIFGLLFLFTANTSPENSLLFHLGLFAGGAVISSAAFKELHDPNYNIHYLTLPLAAEIRYLALWLITGPLYLSIFILLYTLGILAHFLGGTYWGTLDDGTSFFMLALNYLVLNALFLSGSIYFKRLALLKTLGLVLLLSLVYIIIKALAFEQGWRCLYSSTLTHISWLLLGLLALILGYLQLTRSELK